MTIAPSPTGWSDPLNNIDTMATRSDKLFTAAFQLAVEGQHGNSDELLELAHEMRELELRLAQIAEHAPTTLAVLLVKEALTGFDEDTDADQYLEANRDSLKFYAENEAQLRLLVSAALNPKPYERVSIGIPANALSDASKEVLRRIEVDPGRKSVTDPMITPAAIAAKTLGFTAFLSAGGCSILRQCPDCKNKYSTKVHAKTRIYWHCPHCNTIKEA